MFSYHHQVKLHETDAAGVIFYAWQFKITHDAYEAFLYEIGFGMGFFFKQGDFIVPIAHAEADYLKPIFLGDQLEIRLWIQNISTKSFNVCYKIYCGKVLVGTVKTVHVCIDKQKRTSIEIPPELREKLVLYSKSS